MRRKIKHFESSPLSSPKIVPGTVQIRGTVRDGSRDSALYVQHFESSPALGTVRDGSESRTVPSPIEGTVRGRFGADSLVDGTRSR